MASTADPKNPSSMPRSFCANCFEGQKVVAGFPLLVRYAVMGTSRPTSADDSSFAKLENRYSLPSGVTTIAVHLDTAPSTNQFGSRKMSLATGRAPRRPSLIPMGLRPQCGKRGAVQPPELYGLEHPHRIPKGKGVKQTGVATNVQSVITT
jgi:hypothetical protein